MAELTAAVDEGTISEWQAMIDLWQIDPKKYPDPYQELTPEYSLKNVKAEIAKEEGQTLSSTGSDVNHIISESQFLIQGLELEEYQ